jgi:hypothetical protein
LFFTSCEKDDAVINDEQPLSFRDPQSFSYSLDSVDVGDSLMITFNTGTDADCGHVQIQVRNTEDGDWIGGQPVTPDSGVATSLFIPSSPGEYEVRAKYTRTGNPSQCDYESTKWLLSPDLFVVGGVVGDTTGGDTTAMDSCVSDFNGEVVTCDSNSRQVVFTFVSGEDLNHLKIQGGLTSGLEEDAQVTVAGADLDISQRRPGNSTNRIITLEGSAVACDTITITVSWTSTKHGAYITGDWSATGGLTVEALECE